MSLEIHYFAWSILLGLVYIVLAATAFTLQHGLPYAASPRDEARTTTGKAGRLVRAAHNFMETFPFFVAALLLAQTAGIHNDKTLLGTELYFWARVIYLPVYFYGIPYLRTGVWAVSIAGIVMIVCGCCPHH